MVLSGRSETDKWDACKHETVEVKNSAAKDFDIFGAFVPAHVMWTKD